jgi:hypothetical protein
LIDATKFVGPTPTFPKREDAEVRHAKQVFFGGYHQPPIFLDKWSHGRLASAVETDDVAYRHLKHQGKKQQEASWANDFFPPILITPRYESHSSSSARL